jgi:hypothetical protein
VIFVTFIYPNDVHHVETEIVMLQNDLNVNIYMRSSAPMKSVRLGYTA